jgi:hypothetical protein
VAAYEVLKSTPAGIFNEIFNLPYTALPVVDHRNVPTGSVMSGGA